MTARTDIERRNETIKRRIQSSGLDTVCTILAERNADSPTRELRHGDFVACAVGAGRVAVIKMTRVGQSRETIATGYRVRHIIFGCRVYKTRSAGTERGWYYTD